MALHMPHTTYRQHSGRMSTVRSGLRLSRALAARRRESDPGRLALSWGLSTCDYADSLRPFYRPLHDEPRCCRALSAANKPPIIRRYLLLPGHFRPSERCRELLRVALSFRGVVCVLGPLCARCGARAICD